MFNFIGPCSLDPYLKWPLILLMSFENYALGWESFWYIPMLFDYRVLEQTSKYQLNKILFLKIIRRCIF
jgi:hypothetical protein